MLKAFALILLFVFTISGYSQTGVSQFSDPTGKYNTISSGSCVACSFVNISSVADNDLSNHATINVGASLFGATRGIRAKLSSLVPGNTKAGFYVSVSAILSLLPTVNVSTYKAGVLQETIVSNGDVITLLGGSFGNVCGTTSAGKSYDEVEISFNLGVATVGTTMDIYYSFGGFSACPMLTLPVKLIDFSAMPDINGAALLTWKMDDEGNTQYDLQESRDGESFVTIHSEISAPLAGMKSFQFSDNTHDKLVYYRIRITGRDTSKSTFSKILSFKSADNDSRQVDIFPNPVYGNQFDISFKCIAGQSYLLQIFDNTGTTLYNQKLTGARQPETIRPDRILPTGVYNIRVTQEGSSTACAYKKVVFVN